MPEIKKVEIETAETPVAQPQPSDRVIDLAVGVGRMEAGMESDRRELMEVKSELSRACSLIENLNQTVQSLQSQTNRVEASAETAQAVAAATAVEVAESEDSGDVLDVTPAMETHVQIDQVPAGTKRGLMHRLIFGSR